MKVRITNKMIRANYQKNRIFFGGGIENELKYFFGEADYYTAGVYGWNYDAYDFGTFCVVYGYRSFPACVDLPESIAEYMKTARDMARSFSWVEADKARAYENEVKTTFKQLIVDHLAAM